MNELVKIEELKAMDVFVDKGLDPIIAKIKNKIDEFVPDISTKKGRDEIKSLAYNVSRSKTALETLGKTLVADQKKQIAVVDKERIRMAKELDALKLKARQPLTDWEETEVARIKKHEAKLIEIKEYRSHVLYDEVTAIEIQNLINKLDAIEKGDCWDEFKEEAEMTINSTLDFLKASYKKVYQAEQDKIELEEMREQKRIEEEKKEKERIEQEKIKEQKRKEQEQKERDERLKKEAKEKAEREAQEKIDKAAREKEKEKERLIKQKLDAQNKLKAEKEKARIAKAKAEQDQKDAIERERQRVEAEKQKIREDEKKREANLKHRKKINNKVLDDLRFQTELKDDDLKLVIEAIAKGLVSHVKISY